VRKSCKGFLHINHAQSIKKRNTPSAFFIRQETSQAQKILPQM
jgi:hypothetical protein